MRNASAHLDGKKARMIRVADFVDCGAFCEAIWTWRGPALETVFRSNGQRVLLLAPVGVMFAVAGGQPVLSRLYGDMLPPLPSLSSG